ncbi:replication initiator [Streptomyces diastatochromogenes]|uniref:replication initiator n=1 Tax=Streptomyces diastatochromogenes TaxID=42236 RepID=UPI0036659128
MARTSADTRRSERSARPSLREGAEYQRRDLVHFHAVIRLDGPGPSSCPPSWAHLSILSETVRAAAGSRRGRRRPSHAALRATT